MTKYHQLKMSVTAKLFPNYMFFVQVKACHIDLVFFLWIHYDNMY